MWALIQTSCGQAPVPLTQRGNDQWAFGDTAESIERAHVLSYR